MAVCSSIAPLGSEPFNAGMLKGNADCDHQMVRLDATEVNAVTHVAKALRIAG